MKLLQLYYLDEIVRQGLNISMAANALHTSQSGVSRQIAELEHELKLKIFVRNGKRLVALTEPGKRIAAQTQRVLTEVDNLEKTGEEFSKQGEGSLSIATTHTQARYFLPEVVSAFKEAWPKVQLTIHQGNPSQVAAQVASGGADIGIATEAISSMPGLTSVACYQWNRAVVLPRKHPLVKALKGSGKKALSLATLAEYPLITYDFAFAGGSLVLDCFRAEGLQPNIVLTAIDADVIKTYVRLGLGIGLVANMAYDRSHDDDLVSLDASHLFPPSTTYLGVKKQVFLREYLIDFIARLVPQLSRSALLRTLRE
jgi:LysR family cys regulon transcriptional activator